MVGQCSWETQGSDIGLAFVLAAISQALVELSFRARFRVAFHERTRRGAKQPWWLCPIVYGAPISERAFVALDGATVRDPALALARARALKRLRAVFQRADAPPPSSCAASAGGGIAAAALPALVGGSATRGKATAECGGGGDQDALVLDKVHAWCAIVQAAMWTEAQRAHVIFSIEANESCENRARACRARGVTAFELTCQKGDRVAPVFVAQADTRVALLVVGDHALGNAEDAAWTHNMLAAVPEALRVLDTDEEGVAAPTDGFDIVVKRASCGSVARLQCLNARARARVLTARTRWANASAQVATAGGGAALARELIAQLVYTPSVDVVAHEGSPYLLVRLPPTPFACVAVYEFAADGVRAQLISPRVLLVEVDTEEIAVRSRRVLARLYDGGWIVGGRDDAAAACTCAWVHARAVFLRRARAAFARRLQAARASTRVARALGIVCALMYVFLLTPWFAATCSTTSSTLMAFARTLLPQILGREARRSADTWNITRHTLVTYFVAFTVPPFSKRGSVLIAWTAFTMPCAHALRTRGVVEGAAAAIAFALDPHVYLAAWLLSTLA